MTYLQQFKAHAQCAGRHAKLVFVEFGRAAIALWQIAPRVSLWLVVVVVILFAFSGCKAVPVGGPIQRPAASQVAGAVDAQRAKDTTITGSANRIDAVVTQDAPQVSEPVRIETDRIRDAVAKAPASDVSAIVSELTRAMNRMEELVKIEREARAKAEKRADALEDAEMKAQARTLRFTALGILVVAGLLAYARLIQFSLAAAGAGLLCFGLAQLVSQPWFMPVCAGVCGLVLIGFGWAAFHAYKKGDLGAKTEREAERMKSTLSKVVPALDQAMEGLDAAAKQTVRATLSRLMDDDHKRLVHEIRAAIK